MLLMMWDGGEWRLVMTVCWPPIGSGSVRRLLTSHTKQTCKQWLMMFAMENGEYNAQCTVSNAFVASTIFKVEFHQKSNSWTFLFCFFLHRSQDQGMLVAFCANGPCVKFPHFFEDSICNVISIPKHCLHVCVSAVMIQSHEWGWNTWERILSSEIQTWALSTYKCRTWFIQLPSGRGVHTQR